MKKAHLRWLIRPVLLLSTLGWTVSCSSSDVNGGRACDEGIDSDGDGLNDDVECSIGSDPFNPDSDGDGLSDSIEYNYPKICVAQDRSLQRRPAPSCTSATDCQAGETCNGLDPTKSDSDGDGVADGIEDRDLNGNIEFAKGETDPRLWDTDGDGKSDAESGAAICRPDGLGMVVRKSLGPIQLGHDPAFGMATTVQGTAASKYAVVVDDAVTGVAGLILSEQSIGATVTDDRIAIEAALKTALVGATVTDVFVGRQFTTHEQNPAVSSTFRVVKAATSSSALRDSVIQPLSGGTAPGGASAGAAGTFYLDVTTVRRQNLDDVIVSFSPTASYDNPAQSTAIRVVDLVNASGVAESSKDLDFECQGILTGNSGAADIIWTVDISRSMDDNQVRLANTATAFFSRLRTAGVDFRIGVFDAFSTNNAAAPVNTVPMLSNTTYAGFPNGFEFLQGTNAQGDLLLCRYVTSTEAGANGYCPLDTPKTLDTFAPFGIPNGADHNEEPVAAAVIVNDLFNTNAASGVTNLNWQWRPNATKVAFMVTDEPGSNDFNRYFSVANIPGTGSPFAPGSAYNVTTLTNIVNYFKTQNLLAFGAVPVTANKCTDYKVTDLDRCVIETSGGAYVDINNATDADIQAAMSRLVDAIAGAASQFRLTRTPITSTIKVTVRGQGVPRSRLDGFDYDTASRTIVFYGSTYRPQLGDQVFISYRVWKGSLG